MFDQMYDYYKLHRTACMMACRPVVVQSVLMSIIFQHYKQLTKLVDQNKVKDSTQKADTLDAWI
jgi:hypothetical protein